ncbi:hypothetical protein ACKGJO_04105 [Gracilimonas sp. Q87]|uniref:hypothetical protein n=1 Tax=Gracilimonas sp. Q87 TaxID=3384766 RepID=UPI0039842298
MAQSDEYELSFAPDVWYNSVDGIRLGVRVAGNVEGEFRSGPHRLDAGLWLGTALPKSPLSYFVRYTEPIKGISSYANEGSIQLLSTIRTGYSYHEVSFNKRWQPGFDELQFKELSLGFSQEKLIDFAYRPYPQLWQDDWKSIISLNFWISEKWDKQKFDIQFTLLQNVNEASNYFTVGTLEITEQIFLNDLFKLRLRGFGGYVTEDGAPEYLFGYSFGLPMEWLDTGISRAKGTLKESWLSSGLISFASGPNLRGYTRHDFEILSNGGVPQYKSIAAFNTEFEFPNFLNNKLDRTIIGDFVKLRSYVFGDLGCTFDKEETVNLPMVENPTWVADAGIGVQFSINIPDYLGKDRGVALRYEVPFWISKPMGSEKHFKYRNLIGIGAVISF